VPCEARHGLGPRGANTSVTSPWVVSEYREVVRRTKFHRYGFPPHWLEFLIEENLRLPDPATWAKRASPKDMPFLALAHVAGAWLVTGNSKHFPETVRKGVTVLFAYGVPSSVSGQH
jgi:uncharacterized protein